MVNAGYASVPIVSIAPTSSLENNQPGFKPNWYKLIKPALTALVFLDSLSRMYYASASREADGIMSVKLKHKYLDKAKELLENHACDEFIPLLKEAVQDFNAIEGTSANVQTVGVVGEIYIKYNSYGQFNVIDWLVENHVEVVLPPLTEFFTQAFINSKERSREYIDQTDYLSFIKTSSNLV